jgi:5-methylcytosine-specific restriction protein B
MPEITRRRIGELQRAVFAVLMNEPEGMNVQEVSKRAEELCPPTEFENEDYPSQPGQRRYPKMLRFATITSVKAGWLVKDKGIWRLTDDGRSAFESYPDPGDFQQAAGAGYSAWKSENKAPTVYDPDEAAEDAEAAGLELGSARPRRAWLVRGANVEGQNMLPKWFAEGFCSLAFDLAELPPGMPRHEIAQLAADAYADLHPSARGNAVGIIDRFLNEMAIDDIVVTVNGSKIYVGIIAGGAEYADDTSTRMRRAVSWRNVDDPFARSSLSSDATDGLRGQLTVSDLTQFLSEFARRGGIELDAVEETARSVDEIEVQLPLPDAALADALLLPVEWLRETVDLLNDKRQIVLYGPPGTGKTYLAQELCKALVENSGGEYTIVQFHPSYAYEDFFEGLRPSIAQDGSGAVSFSLVPGPLRRMAKLAAANSTRPYVLIIDEINRANLAKVFGELYFLLEYRGQAIDLQYSDDQFRLPRNLFVIGTMNTADRSIALVDAAMRRRFYFQGLFPGEEPIRSLLGEWLKSKGLPHEPARLLNQLNAMINDPDFAIGPSYLMTNRVADPNGLERIWKTAILPLLAEHYFGEGRDTEREFGLPALRRALERETAVAPSEGDVPDVPPDEVEMSANE